MASSKKRSGSRTPPRNRPAAATGATPPGQQPADTPARPWTAAIPAIIIDVILVFAFAAFGRGSHDLPLTPAAIAAVAWPFLVGLGIGWAISRGWRRPLELRTTGISLVISTVVIGVAVRSIWHGTASPAFLVITLAFFTITLLGWRAIAAWSQKRGAADRA